VSANVITIREYSDGSLALSINGRDIPDLQEATHDPLKNRVFLMLECGQFNWLEGDAELPRPTAAERVEMCPITDAPHCTILNQDGDMVCRDCNMPTDGFGRLHMEELDLGKDDFTIEGFQNRYTGEISDVRITKNHARYPEDPPASEDVLPRRDPWWVRFARIFRHR
jgi:hypothetical protein